MGGDGYIHGYDEQEQQRLIRQAAYWRCGSSSTSTTRSLLCVRPGTQVAGWLREAGFEDVDPGARPFSFTGDAIAPEAAYFADIWADAIPSLAALPDAPAETELRQGAVDLQRLHDVPGARLSWVINKATAVG